MDYRRLRKAYRKLLRHQRAFPVTRLGGVRIVREPSPWTLRRVLHDRPLWLRAARALAHLFASRAGAAS